MPPRVGTSFIPRIFRMPGPREYVVRVQQLRPMKMKEKHGEFYESIWEKTTRTLYMDMKLNHKRKWYVFASMYPHIIEAWKDWLVETGVAKE